MMQAMLWSSLVPGWAHSWTAYSTQVVSYNLLQNLKYITLKFFTNMVLGSWCYYSHFLNAPHQKCPQFRFEKGEGKKCLLSLCYNALKHEDNILMIFTTHLMGRGCLLDKWFWKKSTYWLCYLTMENFKPFVFTFKTTSIMKTWARNIRFLIYSKICSWCSLNFKLIHWKAFKRKWEAPLAQVSWTNVHVQLMVTDIFATVQVM